MGKTKFNEIYIIKIESRFEPGGSLLQIATTNRLKCIRVIWDILIIKWNVVTNPCSQLKIISAQAKPIDALEEDIPPSPQTILCPFHHSDVQKSY